MSTHETWRALQSQRLNWVRVFTLASQTLFLSEVSGTWRSVVFVLGERNKCPVGRAW